ncbi:zincin-like metallopeptidase domain-containing protein [Veillonella sp. VA141]|uniref:zincin-like metallopeptidase domain-containing protein n=1 Tax=Veillonella sp. VA141 TaxID=741833 RepID=UPI000F8CCB10|nr:zincin-like metallopeptidase domain-containing protein [Veillonella sp. VA141]
MAITRTYSKTSQTSEAPAEKKTAEDIILEQRKRTAEILVNAIQNTNLPEWQRGYVFRKQYNPISETRYSKANMIHLMAASLENGWTDPRWVTFPQMKAENQKYIDAGLAPIYVLKKGSKGSLIEFHQECYKDPETGKTIPTNRSSDNTNSNDLSEESRNTFWVHQYYKVFNAEQFEKFPPLEREIEDIVRVEQRNKFIENIMENSQAPIHFDQVDRNYYIPSKDEIHLVARENWKAPELLYSTALHEIGHSTGHPSRLHRNLKGGKGSDDYAREELVAEFTSALLHGTYNLERAEQENNAAYIKGWSQQLLSDPNAFVYAIRDAEKAVQYIEENMLDKQLKEELYQQYQAEHAPSKDEIELPKSPKDVLSLSLEDRKKILENGFGIAIEDTEYPDAHYDKPGTIYLGGAANVFGTTIAELSNANEYTYGSGKKGKIYTGKQLNELANDLSKDDVLGAIDKRGYYKTHLTYYMKPISAALDEKNLSEYKIDEGRYDIGDGELVKNHIKEYLKNLAEQGNTSAEIYLAIANSLEKEGELTKPTFEHQPEIFHKALTTAMLQSDPDYDNSIKAMVSSFDLPGHNFLESLQSDKTPLEVLKEYNISSIVDKEPYLDKELLKTSVKTMGYSESNLMDSLETSIRLSVVKGLADKEYLDKNMLSEDMQANLEQADKMAETYHKKWLAYQRHTTNEAHPYGSYMAYSESKDVLDSLPDKSTSNTKDQSIVPETKDHATTEQTLPKGTTIPHYNPPVVIKKRSPNALYNEENSPFEPKKTTDKTIQGGLSPKAKEQLSTRQTIPMKPIVYAKSTPKDITKNKGRERSISR